MTKKIIDIELWHKMNDPFNPSIDDSTIVVRINNRDVLRLPFSRELKENELPSELRTLTNAFEALGHDLRVSYVNSVVNKETRLGLVFAWACFIDSFKGMLS